MSRGESAAPLQVPEPASEQPTTARTEGVPSAPRFDLIEESEGEAVPRFRWQPYLAGACAFIAFVLAVWFVVNKVSQVAGAGETFTRVHRIRPLTTTSAETSEPAFSPDGNYVAFRADGSKPQEGGIFIKAVGGDQLLQVTRNAGDCCPAWSPDGQTIAFSRFIDKQFHIYNVPVTHATAGTLTLGTERMVNTTGIAPRRGELAWSSDGRTLAFASPSGIILLAPANDSTRRLTEPPPLSEDWGPSFSPDGKRLLFVRSRDTDFSEEIMTISVYGGDVTRVASEHARVLGPPQWSFDGQSVIFASDRDSHPALWRVSLTGESPVEINDSGWYPAISRKGYRLAYQRVTRSQNIWQMDTTSKQKRILIPSTSETDQGPGPQPSPDGTKIVYMSDRSGTMEIWVSDRDGGNAVQLTAIGGAGTPRWSPDNKSIVFDAKSRIGATSIYIVNVDEGVPHLLVGDTRENVCPSWSHDGKWVYFASSRTGGWQVWKVSVGGGKPAQVTTHGGYAPLASWDGRYIYYAKTAYANPEIWEVSAEGGQERLISPLLRPATWASWGVVNQGIVFAGPSGVGKPEVSLVDFKKRKTITLGELDTVPFWLGTAPDAKTLLFDQPGWEQAQIMLVDNFR